MTTMVYMATKGTADATLASIPLHMAVNGSIEVGHDVSLILAGDAAEIILAGNADSITGVGVPPMSELLQKAKDHKVPIYV
jgi:predicted peroxiredoxin